jgi:hypothetical protein
VSSNRNSSSSPPLKKTRSLISMEDILTAFNISLNRDILRLVTICGYKSNFVKTRNFKMSTNLTLVNTSISNTDLPCLMLTLFSIAFKTKILPCRSLHVLFQSFIFNSKLKLFYSLVIIKG